MSTFNLYRVNTREATFYVVALDVGEATAKGREVVDEPAIAVTHVAPDSEGIPRAVKRSSAPSEPAITGDEVEYTVTWEIDITAGSPREAAESAWAAMRAPDSMANVFDVLGPNETATRVDLGEDPE